MAHSIDLNCDLGEFDSLGQTTQDAEIMPHISSCNVACGGHAGNADTVAWCIQLAQQHQVAIGAHPSYPDRDHFGRCAITLSDQALVATLTEQITEVIKACQKARATLHHIKPHGALYNQAAKDPHLADLLATLCRDLAPDAALMGLAHSAMAQAATDHGLDFIAEGFIDRSYASQTALTPRTESGAVHGSFETIKHQALALARQQPIQTSAGETIHIICDSLCLHGDHPDAAQTAQALGAWFKQHDITVRAL